MSISATFLTEREQNRSQIDQLHAEKTRKEVTSCHHSSRKEIYLQAHPNCKGQRLEMHLQALRRTTNRSMSGSFRRSFLNIDTPSAAIPFMNRIRIK